MNHLVAVIWSLGLLAVCWPVAGTRAGWLHKRDLPAYLTACHHGPDCQAGYFYRTFCDPAGQWQVELLPYFPEPGDLLLFETSNKAITFCYKVVGSGAPSHATMVFNRPDGTPALLEAGPDFVQSIFLLEPLPRMRDYKGSVMIRRPRVPVCPERSAALTQFALEQEGKDYALCRLLMQGTPFRCRSGLRKKCFACTRLDRERWTCYELTVAAGVVAGTMDPHKCLGNAMYPGDMCTDKHYDLSKTYTPPYLWTEKPIPARLVWDPEAKNHRLEREEALPPPALESKVP
ncbi:MAG: hypothetical protein FJ271_21855 [Planctomycetes bacterium]|nr:hypothetical protein [Planctomycetota bacterium]